MNDDYLNNLTFETKEMVPSRNPVLVVESSTEDIEPQGFGMEVRYVLKGNLMVEIVGPDVAIDETRKIAEKQLKRKITEPFIPLVNEILEHLWNDETTGAKMACIKLMGKMGY
jgi:hypothetical protein